MTRGDLVTVAMAGDFGKPRPALVVQADQFAGTGTVAILLISGTPIDAPLLRLTVEPNSTNGLQKVSQVMVDKVMAVKRERIGRPFGRLDDAAMVAVNRSLALFLGFA